MAIPGGHRFKFPFDDVFPQGCHVISVERAKDYNNGMPTNAVEAISGVRVWTGSALPAERPGTKSIAKSVA